MTGIFSTKLEKTEWLFKQSTYGGAEHIAVNIDQISEYLSESIRRLRPPLYITTLCGKKLKYNDTFSQLRQKSGLVRNICPDCALQSNEYVKPKEKTVDNLPF